MTSDYDLAMGQDKECTYLCKHETNRKGVHRARELIEDGYVVEWIVDNLPGATSFVTTDKTHKYYAAGFKLGYQDISPATGKPRYFLNNHLTLVIRWRKAPGSAGDRGEKVIVGFEVFTKSMEAAKRDREGCPQDVHGENAGMELYVASNTTAVDSQYAHSSYIPPEDDLIEDGSTLTIPYTYAVYFREDEKIDWANRWDLYFNNQDQSTSIHWLAIVNSLVICALLTAVVVLIISRTMTGEGSHRMESGIEEGQLKLLSKDAIAGIKASNNKLTGNLLERKDSTDYDQDASALEEGEELTGWKLLHGDVFRTPAYAFFLAPLVGSGIQLVFTSVSLLLLSTLGVLNPSFRGGFVSVGTGLFVAAGALSGYFSSRLYKTFSGQNWRSNTLTTALLFPGVLFAIMFVLNLFVWSQASSTALPFFTLVAIVALWLLVQLPLVYLGSWFGFHHSPAYEHPTKTNPTPRQIPLQPWYSRRSIYTVLLAGLVPFAVVFIELLFLFRSIWQDKSGYYYVFGFLLVISIVNLITVVEVTIVATYIQLCAENYHWWWQSVYTGAGSALWIFAYCAWWYMVRSHVTGFVSGLLFFGYCAIACGVYGLLMGTVGFLTAYAFVRRIYGYVFFLPLS